MSKRVGEAFFKHVAKRRAPSLFGKWMRSLDSGQYQVPKSFEVMSRFPSDELKLHHATPLRLRLPENQLLAQLYIKYPEVKQETVALGSLQPPVSRRFVWRQLELLQAKYRHVDLANTIVPPQCKQEAFEQVEQEMATDLHSLRRRANLVSGHVALLQAEEEQQLRSALDVVALKSKPSTR